MIPYRWRIGVLFSENAEVRGAFQGMAHGLEASVDHQETLRGMLSSPGFVTTYPKNHQKLLLTAYSE